MSSSRPCAGGCPDDGKRLKVRLTRPGYCPGARRPGHLEDAVFYTKVAFVVVERVGRLKPGTEWISTVRRTCSTTPRPTLIR